MSRDPLFRIALTSREASTLAAALDMYSTSAHFIEDEIEGNFAAMLRMRIVAGLRLAQEQQA